jgi:hypothetical protein
MLGTAIALVCGAVASGAVAHSKLAPLTTGVSAFDTDGSRYAVWQTAGDRSIVIYDARGRGMRRVSLPEGCNLSESKEAPYDFRAAAGRFLLSCRHGQELLLASTGQTTPLPEPLGPVASGWSAIGDAYVEGSADARACRQPRKERRECLAYFDLATRAMLYRPESAPLNIDRPGAAPVCAALRPRLVRDRRNPPDSYWYADGVLAQTVENDRAVRLFYCDRHTHTLTGHGSVEDIELRDGVLTWDTGHPSAEYQAELEHTGIDVQHGLLIRYDLVRGREQVWRLPNIRLLANGDQYRGVLGYSSQTTHLVFWVATRRMECDNGCTVTASDVYAASAG